MNSEYHGFRAVDGLIGRIGDGGAAGREDAVGALGSIAGQAGHRVGILQAQIIWRDVQGKAKVHNEGQNLGAGLIVEGQGFAVLRDVRTYILIITAGVLTGQIGNGGQVFIKGLIDPGAVGDIGPIIQGDGPRLYCTGIFQTIEEGDTVCYGHGIAVNFAGVRVVYIADGQTSIRDPGFEIDENQEGGVFSRPDIAVGAVDCGRSLHGVIPSGGLVIPLGPLRICHLIPVNAVRSTPGVAAGIAVAGTSGDRNFLNVVVGIALGSDDPDISIRPVVENRSAVGINEGLRGGGEAAVRVNHGEG